MKSYQVAVAIRADNIIVATGSSPDFADNSNPRLVNSDDLLRATTYPRRLASIGGGHVGCEFVSIYCTLGREVTLVERENRVLSGWEPEAAERVTETLQTRGVALRLNCEVSSDQIVTDENDVYIAVQDQGSIETDLALFCHLGKARTTLRERYGRNRLRSATFTKTIATCP